MERRAFEKSCTGWHVFIVLVVIIVGYINTPLRAASNNFTEAKVIFRKRCTACHTYGKGIKVGPDLKGVTDRRTRPWLLKFISSSSTVIQSGDPTATQLFREFKQERMPDWTDLSPEQIGNILDYFAAAGPLQKEPDERDATTASGAEIARGEKLFHGEARLQNGGRACDICHSIAGGESKDGHLGPDLTAAYFKYRDRALTDFLKRGCFDSQAMASGHHCLDPQESFDLKAYMAKAGGLAVPVQVGSAGNAATANPSGDKRVTP